jgi:hypothetical protein
MSERVNYRFRPGLERLEAKQTLSASPALASLAHHGAGARTAPPHSVSPPAPHQGAGGSQAGADSSISADAIRQYRGFYVYRLTNPKLFNNHIDTPTAGHVLVQNTQPVPGQVYNVLQIAMRNGTARTFTSSDNFYVKLSGQHHLTPILTGNQVWKPGQWFIFYVVTKKYYPIENQIKGGFIFLLDGAKSWAIPGPSGIFLRLRYNPATINRTLDWIATKGPGAQGGIGLTYGLPDTAIYEFVAARTERNDFGGIF